MRPYFLRHAQPAISRKNRITVASLALLVILALTLAACGGSGSMKPITCMGTCVAPNFLFAAGTGQVFGFPINASSGALGSGTMATGPVHSVGIAATPSTNWLYVSDATGGRVYGYSIDNTPAALTALPGSPFATGGVAISGGLAVDPQSRFLYSPNLDGTIGAFTIGSNGTLTTVSGSPFQNSALPQFATVDPASKFLFVSNLGAPNATISAYTIGSTGALTPVPGSPFAAPATGIGAVGGTLAVDPSSKFLYVALGSPTGGIAAFTISATGALAPVAGSPFPAGNLPVYIALHPSGQFLYAMNTFDRTISAFSVNQTSGALAALTGSPFSAGGAIGGIAIDHSGSYLYAANPGGNNILLFTINSMTGTLMPASTPSFATQSPTTVLTVYNP